MLYSNTKTFLFLEDNMISSLSGAPSIGGGSEVHLAIFLYHTQCTDVLFFRFPFSNSGLQQGQVWLSFRKPSRSQIVRLLAKPKGAREHAAPSQLAHPFKNCKPDYL